MNDRIEKSVTRGDRFLRALGASESERPPGAISEWPEAFVRRPLEFEHPIDCQFLADETISHYLFSAREHGASGRQGGRRSSRIVADFAELDKTWTAATHPLALSEFLAYKAGLAYRRPRWIQHDLLGVDSRGRRFAPGVEQFAFFDTSARASTATYSDTQAYAFVHGRTGYIIFRGTTNLADWSTNLANERTDVTYAGLDSVRQTLVNNPRPARHTGYAIAWGNVAPNIEAWVRDQLGRDRIDGIVLSGHSLGGALAVMAAHQFATRRVCPIRAVVTFGAPKVGGAEFKAAYEAPGLGLKDRTLRVEAADDLVAIISRRADDVHVGHAWNFKKRPLRPTWQMFLFSPLVDAEQATKKKVERLEAKRQQAATDRERRGQAQSSQVQKSAPYSNQPTSEPSHTWRELFIELAMRFVWYVARSLVRSLAAHSVEHRYGLYLSTLSYRKIRAYHLDRADLKLLVRRGQETDRIWYEGAFKEANRDLSAHLNVVRGRHPRTFRYLRRRPIRIETPDKLVKLEKQFSNYVA